MAPNSVFARERLFSTRLIEASASRWPVANSLWEVACGFLETSVSFHFTDSLARRDGISSTSPDLAAGEGQVRKREPFSAGRADRNRRITCSRDYGAPPPESSFVADGGSAQSISGGPIAFVIRQR